MRTATACLLLAVSLQQNAQHDAALSELEQARKIIESGYEEGLKHGRWDRGLWFDWVFARVLLREASEALQNRANSQ